MKNSKRSFAKVKLISHENPRPPALCPTFSTIEKYARTKNPIESTRFYKITNPLSFFEQLSKTIVTNWLYLSTLCRKLDLIFFKFTFMSHLFRLFMYRSCCLITLGNFSILKNIYGFIIIHCFQRFYKYRRIAREIVLSFISRWMGITYE